MPETRPSMSPRALLAPRKASSSTSTTRTGGGTTRLAKPTFSPTTKLYEGERLELIHHLVTLRLNGALHLAPISPQPHRILDLGTGTGNWAVDVAVKYPSATVHGIDVSPTQVESYPPNVRFEIDDVEEPWTYTYSFNLIHGRYLAGAIKDWPRLLAQAYRQTTYGGWAEFHEFDMEFLAENPETRGKIRETGIIDEWSRQIADGIRDYGYEPEPGPKLREWLAEAGFVDVTQDVFTMPVGDWGRQEDLREVGGLTLMALLDGITAMSLRVFTAKGWNLESMHVYLAHVRKSLQDRTKMREHKLYVIRGRKSHLKVRH
ncbi:S-adenosyl-L-methionine-dependent methyltransferase [Lineolata rhizophorae]|uniref:S-adenosyl-L-methionine-dependent methyltransferase n=1 Tax=Lineolata rhizophorae TaxID=578093 RepID=A0A6A6P2T2_9PEZI|nr:S-adenosyl-L-methionine-dependent methyltransferase [Lineolata rhizophorae]